jgi:hypothetical protein
VHATSPTRICHQVRRVKLVGTSARNLSDTNLSSGPSGEVGRDECTQPLRHEFVVRSVGSRRVRASSSTPVRRVKLVETSACILSDILSDSILASDLSRRVRASSSTPVRRVKLVETSPRILSETSSSSGPSSEVGRDECAPKPTFLFRKVSFLFRQEQGDLFSGQVRQTS